MPSTHLWRAFFYAKRNCSNGKMDCYSIGTIISFAVDGLEVDVTVLNQLYGY